MLEEEFYCSELCDDLRDMKVFQCQGSRQTSGAHLSKLSRNSVLLVAQSVSKTDSELITTCAKKRMTLRQLV